MSPSEHEKVTTVILVWGNNFSSVVECMVLKWSRDTRMSHSQPRLSPPSLRCPFSQPGHPGMFKSLPTNTVVRISKGSVIVAPSVGLASGNRGWLQGKSCSSAVISLPLQPSRLWVFKRHCGPLRQGQWLEIQQLVLYIFLSQQLQFILGSVLSFNPSSWSINLDSSSSPWLPPLA